MFTEKGYITLKLLLFSLFIGNVKVSDNILYYIDFVRRKYLYCANKTLLSIIITYMCEDYSIMKIIYLS